MKTIEEPTIAATRAPDEMVAAFKYEKKEGPTLLGYRNQGSELPFNTICSGKRNTYNESWNHP
jgi:hypothetical protein